MQLIPSPGGYSLFYRGDVGVFTLILDEPRKGKAYFRTNLENANVERNETISTIETGRCPQGQGWHDVEMPRLSETTFVLSLAMLEIGHFEAICFFFPEDSQEPEWVAGNNLQINVEPPQYCCANSVYCAFVRQFGMNKQKLSTESVPYPDELANKGYTVIPPSGTFRELIQELDHIFYDLNCRILHLLPINPTPTVYARMGRYGSPYASLDFTGVDPALAEFDKKATPLDQFLELVDAVHLRNGQIFLDIAINHTGWASKIHETNPEWLVRNEDGTIKSPGAWGVIWGDLTELDYNKMALWRYLAEVFLEWCSRGVDGFRCDAGYMIPVDAWKYIIARVRKEYPNSVFLLEGLGGDPRITEELLNDANMNWAYSELFQNYTKEAITNYIGYSQYVSSTHGLMVHYAETHDNSRLAATSAEYAIMRTTISALLASNGAFGFANGVEWLAEEKIDVHWASGLSWGQEKNMVDLLGRLNTMLLVHPAFYNDTRIAFVQTDHEELLAFVRADISNSRKLLILCNLNHQNSLTSVCHTENLGFDLEELVDLISEESFKVGSCTDKMCEVTLKPGQVLCLSDNAEDLVDIREQEDRTVIKVDRIDVQRAKAMALDVVAWRKGSTIIVDEDIEQLSLLLLRNPYEYCASLFAGDQAISVVEWNYPEDLTRDVMIPPNHLMLVWAPNRFRIRLAGVEGIEVQRDSLQTADGKHFVLLTPAETPRVHTYKEVLMSLYGGSELQRLKSRVLMLSKGDDECKLSFDHMDMRDRSLMYLGSNGRGGISRIPLKWGEIYSRYDALLAANLHPDYPVDRQIMWSRCLGWVKFQASSQPLTIDNMSGFEQGSDGSGVWSFHVPVGKGLFVDVTLTLNMLPMQNAVCIDIRRLKANGKSDYLEDDIPVKLILKPDIEDRNFHTDTKAMNGAEHEWIQAVKCGKYGFDFIRENGARKLTVRSSKGRFVSQPKWSYSVFHQVESTRGLEASSDLFSPGYFEVDLKGCEIVELIGEALTPEDRGFQLVDLQLSNTPTRSFEDTLLRAMYQFVVKRDDLKTVIAGYPWFLDWGRDTLICVRGLIAGSAQHGLDKDVASIILTFARFAENGTLPNMIHGHDAANRETSDAPLWLFVACDDYCEKYGDEFLQQNVPGSDKRLIEVLEEIAEGYLAGTANGIKVDAESKLVFSPSHFTWMDTNYPAGTPRIGYPVEIQALWYASLQLLAKSSASQKWADLMTQVADSFHQYFIHQDGWLVDCLHAPNGEKAAEARADDALRSNQLFAITLGLVEDLQLCQQILRATSCLLVPGAIRSLADRPVEYALPIDRDGQLLNNPHDPYWGRYEGDEDTRRKPAYHNGTAWTWPFPSYPEAYYMTYGDAGRGTAKSILSTGKVLFKDGCVGHIPEIMDGNSPHLQRGCDAQAWGVTEMYRVWKKLEG